MLKHPSTDRKREHNRRTSICKPRQTVKKLKRYVTDGDNTYETIMLPRALTAQILKMAHDNLGQEILLLERFKTMCYKTHSKMLSMPKKKYTGSSICYFTFRCGYLSNAVHFYGFDRRIPSSYH